MSIGRNSLKCLKAAALAISYIHDTHPREHLSAQIENRLTLFPPSTNNMLLFSINKCEQSSSLSFTNKCEIPWYPKHKSFCYWESSVCLWVCICVSTWYCLLFQRPYASSSAVIFQLWPMSDSVVHFRIRVWGFCLLKVWFLYSMLKHKWRGRHFFLNEKHERLEKHYNCTKSYCK